MDSHGAHHDGGAYRRLGIELAIDFVIMYFVMYTMIATADHLYLNINNVYMTLTMVSPMAVAMLLSMRSMFPSAAPQPNDHRRGHRRVRTQLHRDAAADGRR